MKKELDLQDLNKNVEQLNACPDNLACLTQTEEYIRRKFGIVGDRPADMYRADFANRFLSFNDRAKNIMFPYKDEPTYCPYTGFTPCKLDDILPDIKRHQLPLKLVLFLHSVVAAKFPKLQVSIQKATDEQKQEINDNFHRMKLQVGLAIFTKMFTSKDSANVWNKLFEKSHIKTLQLLDTLLSLPHNLSNHYINLCENPYKQARDIHQALERLMYLHSFKGIGETLFFSHYDYSKDVRGEPYDIPTNKMDDRIGQNAFEHIEEYYTELTKLLPTLYAENVLSPEEQKLDQRMQKQNSTALHFWARYFCDTFVQVFGKPHYSCVATFISDIFDTCVIDSQVNDLMRKE